MKVFDVIRPTTTTTTDNCLSYKLTVTFGSGELTICCKLLKVRLLRERAISSSAQGHPLNTPGSSRVLDAAYQISKPSVNWYCKTRYFYNNMGVAAMLACDLEGLNKFPFSLNPSRLCMKFDYNCPVALQLSRYMRELVQRSKNEIDFLYTP